MGSEDALRRALAREKRARREAEEIAERATRHLHQLNQELDSKVREATRDLELREEELRASHSEMAEALSMRDHFLASMTHELRSPLHSILGLSEALADGVYGEPNPKELKSLKTIHRSGEHLLTLINNVLEVSKLAAGKQDLDLEKVNVQEVCREALEVVSAQARAKGVAVTYQPDELAQSLFANTLRVSQILINLLSNAIKFTPAEGQVLLETTLDDERESVIINITDSGVGIAQEDFPKLFTPFVQIDSGLERRQDGTGLGLMLVQRMVNLYGGSIRVSSQPGKGSSFTVTLPQRAPQALMGKLDKPSGKALIVEDSSLQRMILTRILQRRNIQSIEAVDGITGLESVRMQRPDVIFLDLNMPKLNGHDVLKLLKVDKELKSIPVAILSAVDTPGNRRRCLEMGAEAYLVKPILSKQLDDFLNRHIAVSSPEAD